MTDIDQTKTLTARELLDFWRSTTDVVDAIIRAANIDRTKIIEMLNVDLRSLPEMQQESFYAACLTRWIGLIENEQIPFRQKAWP